MRQHLLVCGTILVILIFSLSARTFILICSMSARTGLSQSHLTFLFQNCLCHSLSSIQCRSVYLFTFEINDSSGVSIGITMNQQINLRRNNFSKLNFPTCQDLFFFTSFKKFPIKMVLGSFLGSQVGLSRNGLWL